VEEIVCPSTNNVQYLRYGSSESDAVTENETFTALVGEGVGEGLGVGGGCGGGGIVPVVGGGTKINAARIPAATAAALPTPIISSCSLERPGSCCSKTRGSSHRDITDSSSSVKD
jgi:hypothetical protein